MARHPLDPGSLVAGLAFLVIGAIALVGDLSFGAQADLVWPVLLAALGLGLLLSSRSGSGAERTDGEQALDAAPGQGRAPDGPGT